MNPARPRRVEFSPADPNRILVVELPGLVGLWDVTDLAKPVLRASIPAGAIDASFTFDGRAIVTVGLDGRVRWWSDRGDRISISSGGHGGPARAVAAAEDLVASGGDDGTIRLWRADGSPVGEPLRGHTGAITSLAFSPRGDLVSVGADDGVRRWQRTDPSSATGGGYQSSILYQASPPQMSPERYVHMTKYDVHWGWDHTAAFAPNGGGLAASTFDGAIRLWNGDGSPRATLANAHGAGLVPALAWSPVGDRLASIGFNGELRLWHADGSLIGRPVLAHPTGGASVSFSKNGDRLATAGLDDRVRFWDADGNAIGALPGHGSERNFLVALSPRAPVLAAADRNGVVRLWDFNGTPRGEPLASQRQAGYALAFSPTRSELAAGGEDGAVHLWSTSGSPIGTPASGKTGAVFALAFSPDGSKLAVGSQTVELRDDNGSLWQRHLVSTDRATVLRFAPKGNVVVLGTVLGRLQAWNLDGSERMPAVKLPREYISALAVAPGGDVLASAGGQEEVIRLWNLDGSPHGEPLTGHVAPVRALAWSPTVLVSGGDDGTVRLWHPPERESEILEIGLPVNQIGFWGDLLWVQAKGDSIFFYDPTRRLVASMLLRQDALLTATPNGWLAGAQGALRSWRAFREDGAPLSPAELATRIAPERITGVFGAVTPAGR